MSRKTLTFKSPDKVKLFVLIFGVALFVSPVVRNTTASILHETANIISPESPQ